MSIPLTVPNLCNGGLVERIHEEVERAVANITDPNTEAKKPRTITAKITIKPNEHRNMAEVMVSVSSSLQPSKPLETSIMLEHDPRTGAIGASEMSNGENYGQKLLPHVPEKGKIANFNK